MCQYDVSKGIDYSFGGAFRELVLHKSKIKRISKLTIGLLKKLSQD